ncbi:hypothetical protein pb186bvf_019930, partial [Paramecium bursaria]
IFQIQLNCCIKFVQSNMIFQISLDKRIENQFEKEFIDNFSEQYFLKICFLIIIIINF